MTTDELKDYYVNSYRFGKATSMSAISFSNWMKWGFIPMESQCKIEKATEGKLKADYSHTKQLNNEIKINKRPEDQETRCLFQRLDENKKWVTYLTVGPYGLGEFKKKIVSFIKMSDEIND